MEFTDQAFFERVGHICMIVIPKVMTLMRWNREKSALNDKNLAFNYIPISIHTLKF